MSSDFLHITYQHVLSTCSKSSKIVINDCCKCVTIQDRCRIIYLKPNWNAHNQEIEHSKRLHLKDWPNQWTWLTDYRYLRIPVYFFISFILWSMPKIFQFHLGMPIEIIVGILLYTCKKGPCLNCARFLSKWMQYVIKCSVHITLWILYNISQLHHNRHQPSSSSSSPTLLRSQHSCTSTKMQQQLYSLMEYNYTSQTLRMVECA